MVGGRKPRRRLRLGQAVGLASSRFLSGDENPTTAIGAGGRASQRRPFTAFKQIKIVSTGPFLGASCSEWFFFFCPRQNRRHPQNAVFVTSRDDEGGGDVRMAGVKRPC